MTEIQKLKAVPNGEKQHEVGAKIPLGAEDKETIDTITKRADELSMQIAATRLQYLRVRDEYQMALAKLDESFQATEKDLRSRWEAVQREHDVAARTMAPKYGVNDKDGAHWNFNKDHFVRDK